MNPLENDLVENKGGLRNAAQVWTEGESSIIGACDKGEHVRYLSVCEGGGVEGRERKLNTTNKYRELFGENSTLPINTENYLYLLALSNT